MSLYRRPEKNFYILPNKIFTIDLDPYAFKIYSYLMSCAGSKGHCWPSLHTISQVTGVAVSTVKNRIDYLVKRKLISISKHAGKGRYKMPCCLLLEYSQRTLFRAREPTKMNEPSAEHSLVWSRVLYFNLEDKECSTTFSEGGFVLKSVCQTKT